jgi:hypothetical protein
MPFTGGFNPSPERTGGGDGTTNVPLLQRVFEGLAARRGKPFDQTRASAVGAENMALARAITFDLYGSNVRFANEMNPAFATVGGLLPRWERILAQPPAPGDPEYVRQARCAAALARFGRSNTTQPVIDCLKSALGPIFVGLTLFSPSNALTWYPAYGGSAAYVAGVSGNQVTIAGLQNVPVSAPGATLIIENCGSPGNNTPFFTQFGTGLVVYRPFPVQSRISPSSVVVINNGGAAVAPDYGVGGTILAPTCTWSMPNPSAPWMSSIAHIDVLLNPAAVSGYTNPDGSVNGAFYQQASKINPVLDLLLPADVTFDWYVYSTTHGGPGFYFDEQNLDVEIFDQ